MRPPLTAPAPAALAPWLPGAIALLVVAFAALPYPSERLAPDGITSTRIVDRHGEPIYEVRSDAGGYGRWVDLDHIAPALIQATLSGEDARFFRHPGVDPQGVTRALWLNLRAGRAAYGGSTLTQQLAKLLDPQPRNLAGKLVEAVDALRLEATLGKRGILEQYLNRAYYGRQAHGVEAAAQRFFGKSAASLTLDEAALLASLPRAPSYYDPERHPERARRRRAHVLAHMAERGWVSPEAARCASEAEIELVDPRQQPEARHLLDHLLSHGLATPGGADVVTTLDLTLQRRIETRVRMHLLEVTDRSASQAGVVVLDNATGDVLAMVGSRRYGEAAVQGSVNAATAPRQPGSALKPFVYALALEDGDQPGTPVEDDVTAFRDYRPRAARGRHHGRVSYREALGSSLNVPAARVAEAHGINRVARLLSDAGLTTVEPDADHDLSLALGSVPVRLVDLAEAYATLARGGIHLPTRTTLGPLGAGRRVLSRETAWLVTDMLADPRARSLEFGSETPLDLPFPVAAKTGTSQSFCDNVVVGYTAEITVAVWVGNFDGRPMHGVLAMRGAAPLFRDAVAAAMEGRPRGMAARPTGIDEVEICPLSGTARGPDCPRGRREVMATRHGAQGPCPYHGAPQGAGGGPGAASLSIRSPADGTTVRLDPLLRPEAQRVLLRAEVTAPEGARVRWEVDGRTVTDGEAPFRRSWAPSPGAHRIRAVLEVPGGQPPQMDEIHVRVE